MIDMIDNPGSVYIVDEMMGVGKSSAAINYINSSESDDRFIVITPYLDEVERYKNNCSKKHFKEPIKKRGSKLVDIKTLIRKGENIVCTHALFQRFDDEIISMCRSLGYTMIMDEVAEVVRECNISEDDIRLLLNENCYITEDGLLKWRDECQSYQGEFSEIKNLCNLGAISIVRNKALLWLFPVEVFKSFKRIFILTYLFHSQLQCYYYDYYHVKYSYLHVTGTSPENYCFSENKDIYAAYDYKKLINILDNYRLNVVGDNTYALSSSWYKNYDKTAIMKQLANNISNFFRHIRNDNTKDNLWTCFEDFRGQLQGKGYTRGFIPLNLRATNEYRERTSLAYMVNIFLNPMIKGFFQDHGVTVDEDGYALSEMLQWIWRSAIRDGKEIWVYIPSRRMRELLSSWIEEVSPAINKEETPQQ